jgi:hypothetical protein
MDTPILGTDLLLQGLLSQDLPLAVGQFEKVS